MLVPGYTNRKTLPRSSPRAPCYLTYHDPACKSIHLQQIAHTSELVGKLVLEDVEHVSVEVIQSDQLARTLIRAGAHKGEPR